MATWYLARTWLIEIQEVDVSKFTEASVWVNGSRFNRLSGIDGYFPTKAEAAQWLRHKITKQIEEHQRFIDVGTQQLAKIDTVYGPAPVTE